MQIQDEFMRVTEPLAKRVAMNQQKIANLTEIRDLLLPKLISGQLRVRQAATIAETYP
jgi:hypothetical protein